MRAKITALVLSGLVLSGAARGRTGFGCGRNGGHRDVAEQAATRDREDSAAQAHVREEDRARHQVQVPVPADSEWRTIRARLRPLQKMTVQPANA
jgi:hypothetical protein